MRNKHLAMLMTTKNLENMEAYWFVISSRSTEESSSKCNTYEGNDAVSVTQ